MIDIAMTVDEAYLRQLAVALVSISANSDSPCTVHVLHDGVSRPDRDRVTRSVSDRVEVQWIDARAAVTGWALPIGRPPSMYFRLLLSELLPPDLERVIYLDADVIVRRSLRDLWEAPLDAPVGAVRDAYRPWMVRNTTFHWRDHRVPPEAPFFNSGVMLISLEQWRSQRIEAQALALLSGASRMFDQCVLNVVLVDDWEPLPPKWNVQSYHLTGDGCLAYASEGRIRLDEALADPVIVHFTGGSFNRPWQAPCGNPYRDEWYEMLDHTAWRGWRPAAAPAVARALGRARRALRLLRHGGGPEFRSPAGT